MSAPTTTATPTTTVTLRRSARLVEQSKNASVETADAHVNSGAPGAEHVQENVPATETKPVQRSGTEDRVGSSADPDVASLKIHLPARPPKIKIPAEIVIQYLASLKRKVAEEDSEGEDEDEFSHSQVLPAPKKQRTTEVPTDSAHSDDVERSGGGETMLEAEAFLISLFGELRDGKPLNNEGQSPPEGNIPQPEKVSTRNKNNENAEEHEDVVGRVSFTEKSASSSKPSADVVVTAGSKAVVLSDAQARFVNMASPSNGSSNDGLIAAGESISALRSTLRTNATGQAAVPDSEDESEDE